MSSVLVASSPRAPAISDPHLEDAALRVIRRNGRLAPFDAAKIAVAMTKAFLAVEGSASEQSARIRDTVERLTRQVVDALERRPQPATIHIEDVQDQVELALMRAGEHKTARAYVLYREQRARQRQDDPGLPAFPQLEVTLADSSRRALDWGRLQTVVREACRGLSDVAPEAVLHELGRTLYDGVPEADVARALVMSARTHVEREPHYSFVAARLLLDGLRHEALAVLDVAKTEATFDEMTELYPDYFAAYVRYGIERELLDPRLAEFDLEQLGRALDAAGDLKFTYLGLQTLYDRYFLHSDDRRFELPQAFFMRVAMGLAINEIDRERHAIEFYRLLSSQRFMSSTPTLFNAGTLRPQLSSCYLTTVPDRLDGIYSALRDNALLSKYAGGLGNDWTRVRALGAHIKGTNGKSQGVVPFLKVANDTAVAVNQGGKRKGAVCAYLETWHLDIEEFLDLRKNTGDDRRRTHDMHTANWIPDLFLERVEADADWTLFSPDEAAELHDLYGAEFRTAYLGYEARAARGELKVHKTVKAVALWRKMLTMLFETGHPWITFKDACNVRSPQRHVGVVHSSNLCTEITLNTSDDEIAVCNLGSVNLAEHVVDGQFDEALLRATVSTAMRMLDNVIDINYYGVPQARRSNLRHRPVGLGVMAFQDLLYRLRVAYASDAAVELADRTSEAVGYFAIQASTELAAERGRYPTFAGSLWSRGILPHDSLRELDAVRNRQVDVPRNETLDWAALRERVRTIGMRNSNCLAIAPTATISNICGVGQSIEPTYQNLFVKSNLSGEFTVINPYLVDDLKSRGLWDETMVNDLKYFDGSVQQIERVPEDLKALYRTAFEIEPQWLIAAAARRQKWIDQSQSLNLYIAEPSGRQLSEMYLAAWRQGLKTTYYLRSRGAGGIEKSTLDVNGRGIQPRWMKSRSASADVVVDRATTAAVDASFAEGAACPTDGSCEACQ
ncbi:MAG: ribonucleoside-diphosphate reductase subunit alpha [Planctomycetes bacterium]|nr:ribonucleoside-diphosphate reductase subunit alpha [Planctomycetota bacterium]